MVTDVAADVLEPLSDDLAAGLSMAARPGAQAVRATPAAAAPARPAPTQGA
jgi:hypothetical protein